MSAPHTGDRHHLTGNYLAPNFLCYKTILLSNGRQRSEDAEDYLAEGLQNENLSAEAREQRDVILLGFQKVKARYHLAFPPRGEDQHDPGFGQDSSDENQSYSLAPSMTSEASLPSDLRDDGLLFYECDIGFSPSPRDGEGV
ncbi:src kinase-associated phosphoprotein 1-like protein [Pitangus sulphuratus]|nr:src kinase-associated phosphoprotein 1-like protein [Pitangus sulphuratus]